MLVKFGWGEVADEPDPGVSKRSDDGSRGRSPHQNGKLYHHREMPGLDIAAHCR